MQINNISTKELRDNLSEILEKVAIGKQTFLVSKFGREKVLIIPSENTKQKPKKIDFAKLDTYGMWKNRKDMENTAEWVSKMRTKQSNRQQ